MGKNTKIASVVVILITIPFFTIMAENGIPVKYNDLYLSGKVANAIQQNKYDSLGYWNQQWKNLSSHEAQYRFDLLYKIYSNEIKYESEQDVIENLLIFKAIDNGFRNNDTVYYLPHRSLASYPILSDSFNIAMKRFAKILNDEKDIDRELSMLLNFYSGNTDFIFNQIQDSLSKRSFLSKRYYRYIDRAIHQSHNMRFGINLGQWYPSGKLSVLGEHFYSGIQMGVENFYGWGLYLSMEQRFGNLPDSLLFLFDNEEYKTNRYIGGYYGVNVSKDIYSKINKKLSLISGIAIDGFNTTYNLVDRKKYVETNIYSLDINVGMAYKRVLFQTFYTEVKAMYHIVNYKTKTDLDLSGNVFTIGLGIGFNSGRNERMHLLKHLDFKY